MTTIIIIHDDDDDDNNELLIIITMLIVKIIIILMSVYFKHQNYKFLKMKIVKGNTVTPPGLTSDSSYEQNISYCFISTVLYELFNARS